jgi:uncharacterized protein YdhG (YjbR/CyaY superfamily)
MTSNLSRGSWQDRSGSRPTRGRGAISYQIPTFTLDGRRFVHLAGWKAHLSLYPRPDDPSLDAELEPYESGRGTLKFRLDRPIPWELLDRVILALAERSGTTDG